MGICRKLLGFIAAAYIVFSFTLTSYASEYDSSAAYLIKNVSVPTCASVGGEWTIKALSDSRYSVPDDYFDAYYRNLGKILREKKGILDEDCYTEYSRTVIALSSIGKDATDVYGYDLVKPLLDYQKVNEQGTNGAIYALIALDSGKYSGPRSKYINYILKNELEDGGWNCFGNTADPDMTAMAVQALAKYRYMKNVREALTRALETLEKSDVNSSESVSQMVLALNALKIDPGEKLRKELMSYKMNDGSFKHTKEDEEGNIMSTEQALMALTKLY